MNIVTIIPARGGSKGIPKKNIIDFCGKPLLAWSIKQALESKSSNEVFVSSDNDIILEEAKKYGAKTIKRPAELATGTAKSEDTLLHALDKIGDFGGKPVDLVVFLQATSPVRESEDIDGAVRLFMSENADSLFSAAILDDFCLWEKRSGELKSLTYDYNNRGMRQDKKPYYLENGSIYIFKPEIIRKYNNRLGGKIVFYPMPLWKSYEIDSVEDIDLCAYFMYKKILKKSCKRVIENHS